ncbi:hypothetical protein [Bacillus sp. FJAT-28004]|uniref:hypothetical protein n=1 Tax=Bacillus sp. FJAT-28004 TaxID=1679165 RepID=UPI0006B61FE9|nr:hypothetical protein [Bacillus sp. FJAT-28004]
MKINNITSFPLLEQLVNHLDNLDPDMDLLYFESFNTQVEGKQFTYDNEQYQVIDVDLGNNEIPLLGILRSDVATLSLESLEWDDELIKPSEDKQGYYTLDERPYMDLQSPFLDHIGWCFAPGGRYSWNLPGIENGTLIGFYWLPITSIMRELK